MPSYYDVDAILAEEELLQVKPKFPFFHLAHLDPDSQRRKRRRDDDAVDKENNVNSRQSTDQTLSTGAKVKMPLWAVDKWAMLGFVSIPSLPRHYRQRTKERLEADPSTMDLSSKSEHYFLSGMLLTNLLQRTAHETKRALGRSTSRRSSGPNDELEHLTKEARHLRLSLLSTMMGERLCQNFDWTLSALDAIEDDVTCWVQRLSFLELSMFNRGVQASGAAKAWGEFGCGRMSASLSVIKGKSMMGKKGIDSATPGAEKNPAKHTVTPA